MSSLQSQVDRANLLAEARAANTRVQDLISGARTAMLALLCWCARLQGQPARNKTLMMAPAQQRSSLLLNSEMLLSLEPHTTCCHMLLLVPLLLLPPCIQ
jgi:hypothetical protein